MQKWRREKNYMGEDFSEYYVLLSRVRDSNTLTESNFFTALKLLDGESNTVKIVKFRHWLYGWIESILIHKSDILSLETGEKIEKALEDYPVLDEDDYIQRGGGEYGDE